ncbi:serine-rich adhesin for platelets, partial [Hyalella azteca]|uniref:Serine-rich adhesin for platelets n=1 Tax=Hyalella azteca TaxID=294128 RepID=A0A8B7NBU3_HYAAZ
ELQEEVGSLLQFRDAVAAALPLVQHPSSYPSSHHHPHHHPMMVSSSASSPYLFQHHHPMSSPHHIYHHHQCQDIGDAVLHHPSHHYSYPPTTSTEVVSSPTTKSYVAIHNSKNDGTVPPAQVSATTAPNVGDVVSGGGGSGGGATSGGGGVSDSGFTDKNWWSGSMSAKTSSNASSGTEEDNLHMGGNIGHLGMGSGSNRFPGVPPVGGYTTTMGMGRQAPVGSYQAPNFYSETVPHVAQMSTMLAGMTGTTDTIATTAALGTAGTTAAASSPSGNISVLEDELWQLLDVIQLQGSKLRLELTEAQKQARVPEGEFDPGGFYPRRMGGNILPCRLSDGVQSDPSHVCDLNVLQPLPEDRVCGDSDPLWPLSLPPYHNISKPSQGSRHRYSHLSDSRFPFTAADLAQSGTGVRHSSPDSSPRHPNHSWNHHRSYVNQATNHQLVSSLVSRASLAEKEANESQQRLSDLHACLNLLLTEKRKLERELSRRTANEKWFLETHGHPPEVASAADPFSFYRHHESYPPMQYIPYRHSPYGVMPPRRLPSQGLPYPQVPNSSYHVDQNPFNLQSLPQSQMQQNPPVNTPLSSPLRVPSQTLQFALPRVRKIPIRDSNKVPGEEYRKQSRSASAGDRKQTKNSRSIATDSPKIDPSGYTGRNGNPADIENEERNFDPSDMNQPVLPISRPRSKSMSNMRSPKNHKNFSGVPEFKSTSKGAFPKYHLAPSGMLSSKPTKPGTFNRNSVPDAAQLGASPRTADPTAATTAPRSSSPIPGNSGAIPRTYPGGTYPGSSGEGVRGIQSLPAAVRVSPQGRVSVTPNRGRIAAILRERNVLELQRQLLHTVMEAEVLRCQVKVIQQQQQEGQKTLTTTISGSSSTTSFSSTTTTTITTVSSSPTSTTTTVAASVSSSTSTTCPVSVTTTNTSSSSTTTPVIPGTSGPMVSTNESSNITRNIPAEDVVVTQSNATCDPFISTENEQYFDSSYGKAVVTVDGTEDSSVSDSKTRTSGLRGGSSVVEGVNNVNTTHTTNPLYDGCHHVGTTASSSSSCSTNKATDEVTSPDIVTKESKNFCTVDVVYESCDSKTAVSKVVEKVDAIEKLRRRLSRATDVDTFLSSTSTTEVGSTGSTPLTTGCDRLLGKCTAVGKQKDGSLEDNAGTDRPDDRDEVPTFKVHKGPNVKYHVMVHKDSDDSLSISKNGTPRSGSFNARPKSGVSRNRGITSSATSRERKTSDGSNGSGSYGSSGGSGSICGVGTKVLGNDTVMGRSVKSEVLSVRERLDSNYNYAANGSDALCQSDNLRDLSNDKAVDKSINEGKTSRSSTIRAILNRQSYTRPDDGGSNPENDSKAGRVVASSSFRSKPYRSTLGNTNRSSSSPISRASEKSGSDCQSANPICPSSSLVAKIMNSRISSMKQSNSDGLDNAKLQSSSTETPKLDNPNCILENSLISEGSKSETSVKAENKFSSSHHVTNYRKMSVAIEKPPRKSRTLAGVTSSSNVKGSSLSSKYFMTSPAGSVSGPSENGLPPAPEALAVDGRQNFDVSPLPNCLISSSCLTKPSDGRTRWYRGSTSSSVQDSATAYSGDVDVTNKYSRYNSSVLRVCSDNVNVINTSVFNSQSANAAAKDEKTSNLQVKPDTSAANLDTLNRPNNCTISISSNTNVFLDSVCNNIGTIVGSTNLNTNSDVGPGPNSSSSNGLEQPNLTSGSITNPITCGSSVNSISNVALTSALTSSQSGGNPQTSMISSSSFKSLSSSSADTKNSVTKPFTTSKNTNDEMSKENIKTTRRVGGHFSKPSKDSPNSIGNNSRESSLSKSSWGERKSLNSRTRSPVNARNKSPNHPLTKKPVTSDKSGTSASKYQVTGRTGGVSVTNQTKILATSNVSLTSPGLVSSTTDSTRTAIAAASATSGKTRISALLRWFN